MINQNHAAEIRTCERVKFDQAMYVLTMYEKKIRKRIELEEPINAQDKFVNSIIQSWNQKWKMDLTKPLLNCVTSTHPRVYFDFNELGKKTERSLYNDCMLDFIRRLRVEHEDESNFKLIEKDIQQNFGQEISTRVVENFTTSIKRIAEGMQKSIKENEDRIENIDSQVDNTYAYGIGEKIEVIKEIVEDLEQGQKNREHEQLHKFISSTMKIMDNIKQSQHGSTLLTVQPSVDEFTHLLHPMFLPIYGSLLREKEEQKKKLDHKQKGDASSQSRDEEKKTLESDGKPFRKFFTSNTAPLSKILFLNLDGYESEYNLQFARCFRKNLMYVSFPKEDIHSKNECNVIFEKRFYKKLMYNYEKNNLGSKNQLKGDMDEEINEIYSLITNIEDYYKNVESQLYEFDKGYEDFNKNLFVFPLRLNSLEQKFNDLVKENQFQTIDVYESYAILQYFKYFLINQIRQFNPTCVIVSHSGRLRIEEKHFVQIMQQLTKLSHYKIIYFPNLTLRFCQQNKMDHEVNIKDISYLDEGDSGNELNYDFFNKIAQFLKISSGTYSLVRTFEEESILSKFRNLQVLKKINKLMQILGYEYENIEKIRFKNKEIDLIPKLYEEDTAKVVKAFQKLVPRFYSDLYDVLLAVMAIEEKQQNQQTYKLLQKFKVNEKNQNVRELIDHIKNKIVIRNEQQRQVFEKLQNHILNLRQRHFLQISEQKFEESSLLYFKVEKSSSYFKSEKPFSAEESTSEINLSGLINVSFICSNKDSKESLLIFDSTQLHYNIDQVGKTGDIPILIMNHLPLDKKSNPKIQFFSNYCAFLDRKRLNHYQEYATIDKERRIREQKKVKAYPIRLFDEENNEIEECRFQFRVEWNYMETESYMIIYWPLLYNFLDAIALKAMGKSYQPPILSEVFVASKHNQNDTVKFYRANIPDDIVARTGCSAYSINNHVYIFGGFYEKSKNYLSLQRDVTQMNFGMYDHEGQRKLQMSNYKDTLYQKVEANYNQNHNMKPNSYVRARREYQFFDMEDVCNKMFDDGLKRVVMIGGYGQNFLHPYSLLTYYYYLLVFSTEGLLLRVQKKLVYDQSLPINLRGYSKNMGIIKTPIRGKNSNGMAVINAKPQLTEPDSFARFRVVYRINDDQQSMQYKMQFVFSEKDCRLLKNQLRKLEDERYEVNELSNIRMEKIEGMNHMFIIEKHGSKQIVHLRLEVEKKEADKEQLKLTHDSISHLNIINGNYICAIVKHPLFTKNESLVVECKVKAIENENLNEDEAPYVSLRSIPDKQLKGDLTLHILEASNINLIYVLHGHRLCESSQIYEYQITHNRQKGNKTITEIKPKPPVFPNKMPSCCYSIFFYKKGDLVNEIICESYLSFDDDFIIYRVEESFDPSDSNNLCWVCKGQIVRYVFCIEGTAHKVNLNRIAFIDFFRQESRRVIVVQYNKKKYLIWIDNKEAMTETGQLIVVLRQATSESIRRLEQEDAQRGTILLKKPIQYYDKGYITE